MYSQFQTPKSDTIMLGSGPRAGVTWVHRLIFFTGIVSIAVAYITCLIIMKAQGYYKRDITVPFISDLGRDSPNKYIFVVALTIAGISQMIIASLVFTEVIKPKLREVRKRYLNVIAYVSLATAIIPAPFLPAIGLFPVNTDVYKHFCCGAIYFLLTLFTHLMQVVLYYHLYRLAPDECEWRESVKTWGLRRAFLVAMAVPYFVLTPLDVNRRSLSYDECMARIEHTCPGFTKASLLGVQKYPWRRKNGKALSGPYECPIPCDEFERIPEGEPMEEIRVTTLWSFAQCNVTANLLTISQAVCVFAMSLAYVTFYFDFVFARSLQGSLLG